MPAECHLHLVRGRPQERRCRAFNVAIEPALTTLAFYKGNLAGSERVHSTALGEI